MHNSTIRMSHRSGASETDFTDGVVTKKFLKNGYEEFEREKRWLEELQPYGVVPEVYEVDESEAVIRMAHAGEQISSATAPADWRSQLSRILDILRTLGCKHNDLGARHVLVGQDSKLRIIDFGFATRGFETELVARVASLGKRRVTEDQFIINYLDTILDDARSTKVGHVAILWDPSERDHVVDSLSTVGPILLEMAYSPSAVYQSWNRGRLQWLDQFYRHKQFGHGQKATRPFLVYYFLDLQPRYGLRENLFTAQPELVNTRVFELKKTLRAGRTGLIHMSAHPEETFDNSVKLSLYPGSEPLTVFENTRPSFFDWEDVFSTLESTIGLDYVVLRGAGTDARGKVLINGDLDVLVNDYLLAKSTLGALSYKHKLNKLNPSYGDPFEYGGTKVANRILVGGVERDVDIRFIGDGYFPPEWSRKMLSLSVKQGGYRELDAENHLFSIAYHALVHKSKLPPKYFKTLSLLLPEKAANSRRTKQLERLYQELETFMAEHSYEYSRCIEPSVLLNVKAGSSRELELADWLQGRRDAIIGNPLLGIQRLRAVLKSPRRPLRRRLLSVPLIFLAVFRLFINKRELVVLRLRRLRAFVKQSPDWNPNHRSRQTVT